MRINLLKKVGGYRVKNDNFMNIIADALMDYVDPIYIVGDMDRNNGDSITTISATIPREELFIRNNVYPLWYSKVVNNSNKEHNILLITDFDKISTEEQKLFLDIICKQHFSSEKLPSNLKIIINSSVPCPLLPDIREVIQ